jgi:hypothetical protein
VWLIFIAQLAVIAIALGWAIREHNRRTSDWETLQKLFSRLSVVYEAAKAGTIDKASVDAFADYVDKSFSIINSRTQFRWGPLSRDVAELRDQIQQASLYVATRSGHPIAVGAEIEKLASLRQQGMISAHEFDAFSDRFRVSTGQKARDIIMAISQLHEEHQRGALSEGNYHAALWGLLDKLDRRV